MKPTDEERREVAEKLRAKLRERDRPGVFVPRGIEPFALLLMEDIAACLPSDDSMFAVLADLIEPAPERTCRDLGGEDGTVFEHYDFGCSECGFASCAVDARFCPECGARVTVE